MCPCSQGDKTVRRRPYVPARAVHGSARPQERSLRHGEPVLCRYSSPSLPPSCANGRVTCSNTRSYISYVTQKVPVQPGICAGVNGISQQGHVTQVVHDGANQNGRCCVQGTLLHTAKSVVPRAQPIRRPQLLRRRCSRPIHRRAAKVVRQPRQPLNGLTVDKSSRKRARNGDAGYGLRFSRYVKRLSVSSTRSSQQREAI